MTSATLKASTHTLTISETANMQHVPPFNIDGSGYYVPDVDLDIHADVPDHEDDCCHCGQVRKYHSAWHDGHMFVRMIPYLEFNPYE